MLPAFAFFGLVREPDLDLLLELERDFDLLPELDFEVLPDPELDFVFRPEREPDFDPDSDSVGGFGGRVTGSM